MRRRHLRILWVALPAALLAAAAYEFWPMIRANLGGSSVPAGNPPATRPAEWAVSLERPGLSNFHRVSDGLYRGAQPTAEGMRQLRALGIRTVVNLREFHSDDDLLGDTGLEVVDIPMGAWRAEDGDLVKFLRVVADPRRGPVFVHCQHGSDRTGTMCAVYRIAVCGWDKDEALREMTQGGFGFHEVFGNLPEYLQKLDVDALKRRAAAEE